VKPLGHRRPHRRLAVIAAIAVAATAGACEKTPKPEAEAQVPSAPASPVVAPEEQAIDTRIGCLNYAETVSLHGELVRETHPGRPNYTSIKEGDEEETGFYLHLDAPVCTYERWKDVPDERAMDSVVRVQLILDSAGYVFWRPKLGRKVNVLGWLVASYTGHHHAPLLLYVEGEDTKE